MNAEFQRRARRDKKAFLNDQCKEIEENNKMRKTRDPSIKLEIPREKVHAKMGVKKDRNDRYLTEQKILRRDGKNTQKNCTKKSFTTQTIMMM